jgi:hypothetical protein
MGEAGYTAATLWVIDGNRRARRFYAAAGWSVDGATKEAVIADVPVTLSRRATPPGAVERQHRTAAADLPY